MKKLLAAIIAMMALISFASADGNSFTGDWGANSIWQSNVATSNSDTHPGVFEQHQSNTAIVVGEHNSIFQSNFADAQNFVAGGAIRQFQNNMLVAVGFGNDIAQSNYALAENYGGTIKQVQKNLAVVVGFRNDVEQSNDGLGIQPGRRWRHPAVPAKPRRCRGNEQQDGPGE